MKKNLILAFVATLTLACTNKEQNTEVILQSEIIFNDLNPARGDQSPKAGDVWGDRQKDGPTGFLFKPTDGFSSPPHIHNVSYRGVVIRGLIHNDDANAENMWMPAGSFWTQPKGNVHITSAKGEDTLAYIEIDEGPYLVMSSEEEFHTKEVAINVDQTNMIWLDSSNVKWINQGGAQVAFLWGNPNGKQLRGNLIKLPAGFKGSIKTKANEFRAILVEGQLTHGKKVLNPGSYFSSKNAAKHKISCLAQSECLIYLRTDSKFKI